MKLRIIILALLGLIACRERISPRITTVSLGIPEGEDLRKVVFRGDQGLVLGGQRYDRERILWTEDGGNRWESSELNFDLGKMAFDALFLDDSLVFVAAFDGKILRSEDGGKNFVLAAQTDWLPLRAVAHASDSILLVVGGTAYSKGLIWRSADRGQSWMRIDTPGFELRDVAFVSENVGFACGYGAILKTIDAGESWFFTPAGNEFFTALAFPGPFIGYAVGRSGTILKTEDRGESWQRLRNGNIDFLSFHSYNDVYFEDEENGYIVGDSGLIMQTRNGGKSWTKINWPGRDHLFGISMHPDGQLYVAGDKGMLWRFRP